MIKILYTKQLPQLNQFFSNHKKSSLFIFNQETNFVFEDKNQIVIKNAALYFELMRQDILEKNNLISEWDKKGMFEYVLKQQKEILKTLINQNKDLIILTNTKENDNFCEPNLPNKILDIFMAMPNTTINYVDIYEIENQKLVMHNFKFRYGYLSKIAIDSVKIEEDEFEEMEEKVELPKIRKKRTKKSETKIEEKVETIEEIANKKVEDENYFDELIEEETKDYENLLENDFESEDDELIEKNKVLKDWMSKLNNSNEELE